MGIDNIATTNDGDRAVRRQAQPLASGGRGCGNGCRPKKPARRGGWEETTQKGGALRRRRQPPDRQAHRGRGRTHRTRYRRGTADGNPRPGTASKAPAGHAALVGVRGTRLVLGLQSQTSRGGVRGSRRGVHVAEVQRVRLGRQGKRAPQAAFDVAGVLAGHADRNAARNIAVRGVERWGEVMRPHAAPTLTESSWPAPAAAPAAARR